MLGITSTSSSTKTTTAEYRILVYAILDKNTTNYYSDTCNTCTNVQRIPHMLNIFKKIHRKHKSNYNLPSRHGRTLPWLSPTNTTPQPLSKPWPPSRVGNRDFAQTARFSWQSLAGCYLCRSRSAFWEDHFVRALSSWMAPNNPTSTRCQNLIILVIGSISCLREVLLVKIFVKSWVEQHCGTCNDNCQHRISTFKSARKY